MSIFVGLLYDKDTVGKTGFFFKKIQVFFFLSVNVFYLTYRRSFSSSQVKTIAEITVKQN